MSTRRAPCPQCDRGPRDTALAITTDERGTVSYCHRCGYVETEHHERRTHVESERAKARQLQSLKYQVVTDETSLPPIGGNDRGTAASIAAKKVGAKPRTVERAVKVLEKGAPIRTTAHSEPLDWSTRAESIWRRTQALKGTLGETYLHHRGCVVPPRDSHLRYLPGDDRYPPSLCAAVTDIVTAKPISLHFTRLATDGKGKAGTERDKLLLAGHRKRGGCIRLWPDEAVTHGLAIAEGIESALSAAHAYAPVWAAIDAGNLAAFPVLVGIDSLVIFHDADDRGIEAAAECAARWSASGKDVLLVSPSKAQTDINDEVNA